LQGFSINQTQAADILGISSGRSSASKKREIKRWF